MTPVTIETISLKRSEFGFAPVYVTSVEDIVNYVQENQPYKKKTKLMVFDKNYIYINLCKTIIGYDESLIIPRAQKNGRGTVWCKDKYISTYDQHPIISLNSEHFGFYVMDKLKYAKDIRKYLHNNYGDSVNFFQVDETLPIAFNGYTEKSYRLFDKPNLTIIRDAAFHYIRPKNVVVDKNLHQIWKDNTGKYPDKIVEMFNSGKVR